jgi:hypothetical protein
MWAESSLLSLRLIFAFSHKDTAVNQNRPVFLFQSAVATAKRSRYVYIGVGVPLLLYGSWSDLDLGIRNSLRFFLLILKLWFYFKLMNS